MSTLAAIVYAAAALAWAMVAWDLGRKWIADRSAVALHKRQAEWEAKQEREVAQQNGRLEVNKLAIANLAKELDEELSSLRAQQVGVISGMSAAQKRGVFR